MEPQEARNPTQVSRELKSQTLNPKPLNPKILNPKPEAPNPCDSHQSAGMLDMKEIHHIFKIDREQFALMLFVASVVVVVDTTVGILAGVAISLLHFTAAVAQVLSPFRNTTPLHRF